MQKINIAEIKEDSWESPQKQFAGFGKELSMELGRDPLSTDLLKRHPFDVEIMRVAPGKTPYVYHSHSAQWEFYHVMSGRGSVRDEGGWSPVEAGDAFVFKPGEAHQLTNDGTEDLVVLLVADNPIGESTHYPDSGKWVVRSPERRIMRSEDIDYFDGEE